jgi:glucosamine--fructose-6-phosphate aminotransferase (isomerizing)
MGYVGPRQAAPILIDGLRRLEYRGYDSAGVAVCDGRRLVVRKAEGKLARLAELLDGEPVAGTAGIGHTRWATHGVPSDSNAHPHTDPSGEIAVVHNGIIENYLALREELAAGGAVFASETDSEVLAHLIAREYRGDLLEATRQAVARAQGAYALVVTSSREPDRIVAVRMISPLVVGFGAGEVFLASDIPAILPHTREVMVVDNGEIVDVTPAGARLQTLAGAPVQRDLLEITWDAGQAEKGGYPHFMLKEIHEQPGAVAETLEALLPQGQVRPSLAHLGLDERLLAGVARVQVIACGTSWHAAHVGKFYLERLARVPCDVDYASEFRYREPLVGPDTLVIGISQSGETADTLAAMRLARERGGILLAICNVRGAQATRLADCTVLTHAGPEVGVASTKAFTTQLVALLSLALALREAQGDDDDGALLARARALPYDLQAALDRSGVLDTIAAELEHARNVLYLGRGVLYPLALEGALKLKEISYLHAEGYPAGEMKHGPIALLDEQFPVIALCPPGELAGKVLSNVQEVRARRAPVYAVGDPADPHLAELARAVVPFPPLPWPLQPIVAAVPLQLLAYQVAVRRGCDIDQPRNLAKSVTVE